MKIRLVHTQSLFMFAAVLVALLAMGVFNAWNLRSGFADFLIKRDVERLEQLAVFVGESADAAGGIDMLDDQGLDLRELLRQFARTQVAPADNTPATFGAGDSLGSPHLPRPPPAGRANAFRERVGLYALNGAPLLGAGLNKTGDVVERPVRVRGAVVATLRMVKLQPVQDDFEVKFLISQYTRMAWVALALLIVALLGARWLAERWVQPLLQIQSVTQRISAGQFDVQLPLVRTDEIGDVMRNINRMAAELKQLESSRRRWLADMSHELRTPLTVLRGEIDALVEGIRTLEPRAMLSLRDEVQQLTRLVDDLHLLATSDLKALPCYFEDTDAKVLVHTITARFASRAKQQGMTLTVSAQEPGASMRVRWDGQRIGQLLSNLLDNSLRYTDAPGLITVQLTRHSDRALIVVEDSAPNVTEADLAQIFEPLYRADVARSRQSGGSGLGLAICKAIVQAHQGSIQASLCALGGIQVRVDLPLFAENSDD